MLMTEAWDVTCVRVTTGPDADDFAAAEVVLGLGASSSSSKGFGAAVRVDEEDDVGGGDGSELSCFTGMGPSKYSS